MWFPDSGVRIWLYTPPTDMRKSFDGLAALVKQQLAEDPLSGQLFAFINRKRTQMKVLYFDRTGYCLWSKRLERGQFHWDAARGDKQALDPTALTCLLEGIDWRSIRRYKRYRKSTGFDVKSGTCRTPSTSIRAPGEDPATAPR
ncbi:IS66 family insertion sequence element accessory protein TnpB [Thiohalocapsa marina]|nr:IS66 family insertion sequence element accessory protein TnpB [Thiohalocapsa marina]